MTPLALHEPSPPTGGKPLPWWSQTWRLALATLLGLATWAATIGEASSDFTTQLDLGTGALMFLVDPLLGIVCLVLVAYRRRHPLAITCVVLVVGILSQFSAGAQMLAMLSLATRRRWQDVPVVLILSVATSYATERVLPAPEPLGFVWLSVLSCLVVTVILAVGWYIGARRDLLVSLQERAETLEREQAVRLEAARSHERAAIAREMHDVLAHRMSLVAMHAGALTYRTDLDENTRAEVARTIESNTHLAMADLRDVLGVLRESTPGTASVDAGPLEPGEREGTNHPTIAPPQPVLADLPHLVDETRAAGVDVTVEDHVAGTPPTTLARHAYRIVQESLTNARKHAPGSPVALRISGAPGEGLHVDVSNPLPAASLVGAGQVLGAGAGIVGMTERAALAGGRLTHGPTKDGGFTVHADLPWPLEETR